MQISATSSAGGTSAPVGDLQIVSADPAAGQCAVDAQKAISCQGAQVVLPGNGSKEFVFKVKVTPPAVTTPISSSSPATSRSASPTRRPARPPSA